MGWQQYSRPLWLSRGNPYILYPNAITAQMRVRGLVFHKWRGFSGIGVPEYVFRGRHVGRLMPTFLRGLILPSCLPQGLASWAIVCRPLRGWCLVVLASSVTVH